MISAQDVLKRVRQAQSKRAAAYQTWNDTFRATVAGDRSVADYEAVAGLVATQLNSTTQEIRSAEREAYATAQVLGAQDKRFLRIPFLVDELQSQEKVKYECTVELQRVVALHITKRVAHDPDCSLMSGYSGVALITGVGSSGFDCSSEDDDTDELRNSNDTHHHHDHSQCVDPAIEAAHGTKRGNQCLETARNVTELRRSLASAVAAINEVLDEIQCELADE